MYIQTHVFYIRFVYLEGFPEVVIGSLVNEIERSRFVLGLLILSTLHSDSLVSSNLVLMLVGVF